MIPESIEAGVKPESLLNEFFLSWIARNPRTLKCKPKLLYESSSGYYYGLQGATKNINLYVGKNDGRFYVLAVSGNKLFDRLAEFDILVAQLDTGEYKCILCIEDDPEQGPYLTKNLFELLEDHTFKQFAAWCERTLRRDHYLVFYEMPCGTWAKIADSEEGKNIRDQIKQPDNEIELPVELRMRVIFCKPLLLKSGD